MASEDMAMQAGTVTSPTPSMVAPYIITYMQTGVLPVEIFRTVAVGGGSGAPQRTEEEAWADLSARARAAWSRENPA